MDQVPAGSKFVRWLIVGSFAAAIVGVACSKGSSNVSGAGGGTHVKVTTSGGTFEGGTGTTLPEGFPSNFPMPQGSTVTESVKGTQNGKTAYTVGLSAPGTSEDAFNFYKGALPGAGYAIGQQVSTGSGAGLSGTIAFTGNGFGGGVVVTPGTGRATIVITMASLT